MLSNWRFGLFAPRAQMHALGTAKKIPQYLRKHIGEMRALRGSSWLSSMPEDFDRGMQEVAVHLQHLDGRFGGIFRLSDITLQRTAIGNLDTAFLAEADERMASLWHTLSGGWLLPHSRSRRKRLAAALKVELGPYLQIADRLRNEKTARLEPAPA